jgi:DNA-binding PucR family transcriptional regulator
VNSCLARGQALEAHPGGIDLFELIHRERWDPRTAEWQDLDEPLLAQEGKRLTHGHAADAELGGELLLAKPHPRRNTTGEDPGTQLAVDPADGLGPAVPEPLVSRFRHQTASIANCIQSLIGSDAAMGSRGEGRRMVVAVRAGLHVSKGTLRVMPRGGNVRRARLASPVLSVVHTPLTDDTRVLSGLLAAIGSTSQPVEVAQRAVESLVASAGCSSAQTYFWRSVERQLIRSAIAPLDDAAGFEDSYAIGTGIVGGAAMTPTRTTFAPVEPGLARARANRAPSRSTAIVVPITARDGALLGVLVAVTAGNAAPSSPLALLVRDTARIIGLAAEQDALANVAARQGDALELIVALHRSADADTSLAHALAEVASIGLRVLQANTCAIYIADRSASHFRLAACAPHDAGFPAFWRDARDGGWRDQARSVQAGDTIPHPQRSTPQVGAVAIAPASAGADLVVALFGDERRRAFVADELRLCGRVAGVAAMLVRQRRLVDYAMERRRSPDVLWDLIGSAPVDRAAITARAQRLGCDLGVPRVVLVANATGAAAERLRLRITGLDRTALADVGDESVVAVVAADAARAITDLDADAGMSQECREVAGYPIAYRQAQDALGLGVRLFGHGHVTRHDELGSYRFVPALIESGLTTESAYQNLARLSDDLLRTLEAYLDCGGNTALAAKQLFLHRNTLRQRLERIAALIDLDLTRPSAWLPLNLAIKTARLSRLNAVATAETHAR